MALTCLVLGNGLKFDELVLVYEKLLYIVVKLVDLLLPLGPEFVYVDFVHFEADYFHKNYLEDICWVFVAEFYQLLAKSNLVLKSD